MGNMDGHSGNVTSTTFWHHLRDFWKSPRGTVFRIEVLAGVAIITAFLLAAFGSSRRWSKRWIVQKGFFAAHALSLSLGTYSIGLMQTSPVKSEMYPIWTVSLFTLFGCIDPVTTYNGLDYKGLLSKSLFGICLTCGYVLLMSNTANFSNTSSTAINVLAVITFIKSFHRSMALVQQSKMQKRVQNIQELGGSRQIYVDFLPDNDFDGSINRIHMLHVEDGLHLALNNGQLYHSCYNACFAFGVSHMLQCHILGLGYESWPGHGSKCITEKDMFMWAMKVIEIELAFLYDIFFTGYPFLHYYQAKATSLWTLASFTGICFVGIAAVTNGRTSTSRRSAVSPGGCTNIVDTTALDLGFTYVILVSLALLELMHLIQGWTSNWARCAIAWECGMKYVAWVEEARWNGRRWSLLLWSLWMRLRASVATSTTWFNKYLWQEEIGQCSIQLPPRWKALLTPEEGGGESESPETERTRRTLGRNICSLGYQLNRQLFSPLIKMLGFHYVWKVLWDLLGNDTKKGDTVKLDGHVMESIVQFLGDMLFQEKYLVEDNKILGGNWLRLFPDEHPLVRFHLLHLSLEDTYWKHGGRYTICVMTWYTATWRYKQVEREREEALTKAETAAGERERNQDGWNRNRHVANVLSKYCIYLVVSAPELLPGPASETRLVYDKFVYDKFANLDNSRRDIEAIYDYGVDTIANGFLGNSDDPWGTLAGVWIRLLLYAAPYGNVEAHVRHLAQGGEFITHLWAMLYFLDIREWKLPEAKVQNITTVDEAHRILKEDEDIIVVAFFATPDVLQKYRDNIVTVQRLVAGVKVYQTSSHDVAGVLSFPASESSESIRVLVRNKVENHTGFFDDWGGRPYDFAYFVYKTKLDWAKERAPEAAPSNVDNLFPIEEQSSEGGHTVVEIEEIPSPLQQPPPS